MSPSIDALSLSCYSHLKSLSNYNDGTQTPSSLDCETSLHNFDTWCSSTGAEETEFDSDSLDAKLKPLPYVAKAIKSVLQDLRNLSRTAESIMHEEEWRKERKQEGEEHRPTPPRQSTQPASSRTLNPETQIQLQKFYEAIGVMVSALERITRLVLSPSGEILVSLRGQPRSLSGGSQTAEWGFIKTKLEKILRNLERLERLEECQRQIRENWY